MRPGATAAQTPMPPISQGRLRLDQGWSMAVDKAGQRVGYLSGVRSFIGEWHGPDLKTKRIAALAGKPISRKGMDDIRRCVAYGQSLVRCPVWRALHQRDGLNAMITDRLIHGIPDTPRLCRKRYRTQAYQSSSSLDQRPCRANESHRLRVNYRGVPRPGLRETQGTRPSFGVVSQFRQLAQSALVENTVLNRLQCLGDYVRSIQNQPASLHTGTDHLEHDRFSWIDLVL